MVYLMTKTIFIISMPDNGGLTPVKEIMLIEVNVILKMSLFGDFEAMPNVVVK